MCCNDQNNWVKGKKENKQQKGNIPIKYAAKINIYIYCAIFNSSNLIDKLIHLAAQ